ncbi:helix-turn-helix domain-containing protein [Kitasatospora sp. NBC_00240]|uniref:AraC-like ligand-binding domain-containing protein n=1 Tax=Kitasatospora sp. NBC_00240 TaxID=2903567 RepID=UPI00225AC573|nr:helix-turn-helix domain-containing protein [Kitasatospora sp. NBC_00240]MCX5207717.1 helix-turn-helix domain-containing protein [Kitasatospora sp. NBC_00240]MCX5216055.1 helix-turn-helix domain-containing protein [Kitasatospora sp. NBC_00240]
MGWTSVSSAVVAPADGFEWFRERLSTDLMPVAVSPERAAGFRAEITNVELGPVQVSAFAFSPARARRTSAHVRQGDPEEYQLALITEGTFRTSQRGNESLVSGDLVLTDTSRPMENVSAGEDGRAGAIMLQIPRAVLPLHPDRVDRLLARGIPATEGTGAVVAGFLTTLLHHGPGCRPEELSRLGSITLDLATACLAQQLGVLDEAPAEARAQLMVQRIHGFIDHNLGDPGLTPRAIADHHRISLRGLYALFDGQSSSVAATIRRRRLERCRVDLTRHTLSSRTIQEIATHWGFSSATAFSRAFREEYGITPTEHRAGGRQP